MVADPRHVEKQHAREPGDVQGVSAASGSSPVREGESHKADMYVLEESDHAVVPMKLPNKKGRPLAEVGEGRAWPKANFVEPSTSPTQSGERVSQGLHGVPKRRRNGSKGSSRLCSTM